MKVDIKKLTKSNIEVQIEISAEKMDVYYNEALKKMSLNLNIKGFRPGKVPAQIAEKELNSQDVLKEAADIAIKRTLPKAIEENGIDAITASNVSILKIARNNPFVYKIEIAVMPEVKLGDYRNVRVKKEKAEVSEKEIQEALKYLQKSRTKYIAVTRPIQKGDRVEIDFTASINGIRIEHGESKNQPLIIGDNRFVPGFEDNLEGMELGAEKRFSVVFPKDYYKKDLASKEVDFFVKINSIQKTVIPELNDEFAKSLGSFDNLEMLKNSVRQGILREKKNKNKEKFRAEIISKIADSADVEISGILIERELDKMIQDLSARVQEAGLKLDDYLIQIRKSVDDLRAEWKKEAGKRVKTALVLKEIAKREKISPAEEEIENRINDTLKRLSTVQQAESKIDLNSLREYTKEVLRNEKTFELLESIAEKE